MENNTEIVCVQYGDEQVHTRLASMMFSEGKTFHTDKVDIINLKDFWVSPDTKTKYPLSWQIKIPELDADFIVEPLIKDQEMIFGFINYWEGPLKISGTFKGKKISGQGFLELLGCPMGIGKVKMIESEVFERLKKFI